MHTAVPSTPDHHRRDLERLQQHLRENFPDPTLSVSAASDAVFVSVRYAQKLFAQAGTTPSAWLSECRMAEARRLLRLTELPVSVVALRVGYRDTSQFSRGFKARTGVSPSGYRLQRP